MILEGSKELYFSHLKLVPLLVKSSHSAETCKLRLHIHCTFSLREYKWGQGILGLVGHGGMISHVKFSFLLRPAKSEQTRSDTMW